MNLPKQPVNINFQKGLDTKNDPFQIPVGNFLALNNSVFDSVGRLTKRNGFTNLAALPPSGNFNYLNTFNDNLVAIGNCVSAYSASQPRWTNPRPTTANILYFQNQLSVTPIIRNNSNQTASDSVVAPSGLSCTVYTTLPPVGGNATYSYVVSDATNGQIIVPPATFTAGTSGYQSSRVFLLGNYFVIVYTYSSSTLKYFTINTLTLAVTAPTTIDTSFTESANGVAWDGVVASSKLYLAFSASAVMKMRTLDTSLVLSAATTVDASHQADVVGVWADTSQSPNSIWVAYWSTSTTNGYALVVNTSLASVLAATQIITSTSLVVNITGVATAAAANILWEQSVPWTYDASIYTANTTLQPVTQSGTVGSTQSLLSFGLGSKAFIANSNEYVAIAYGSQSQSTYFVINVDQNFASAADKIAYQNGGGLINSFGKFSGNVLPSVSINNLTAYFSYLFKDFVTAVNKSAGAVGSVTGVYSQLGINIASITFGSSPYAVEGGGALNISGGFLWDYDGLLANENNFFLWPELQLNTDGSYKGITTASSQTVSITGSAVNGTGLITTSSSVSGMYLGMVVTDSTNAGYIPAGAVVTEIITVGGTSYIYISKNVTHAISGDTIVTTGNVSAQLYNYQFIYQWTDNQGNIQRSAPSIPVTITASGDGSVNTIIVPCLTLSYKTNIIIVGYRWSTAQQSFYQFTSVQQPTQNSSSSQTVTIHDANNDSTILGNALIYTTGGVVEDIGPPASHLMTLFDDRLWLVDDEDPNLLWFSKQIIEATPIEMSDLLTFFVAPTIAGQGSTGQITSLGAMDDKLILLKKHALYYVNGSGPDNTGANNQYSQPIFITSPVGCTNQKSITLIPDGIMFQASEGAGIWLLGRNLQVQYIGAPVQQYNGHTVTSATTIPGTTQVRFTLDNDSTILMYDYFVGQWATFSGMTATNSVSSTVFNGLQTLIDAGQNVYQEIVGTYLDGVTNTNVVMSFTTGWLNLAGIRGYQRAYWFFFLGNYLSANQLQCTISYDYDYVSVPQQVTTFTPTYSAANTTLRERIFLDRQKCSAVQFAVQEIDGSAGAALTLSAISLIVAAKKGYAPIKATESTG